MRLFHQYGGGEVTAVVPGTPPCGDERANGKRPARKQGVRERCPQGEGSHRHKSVCLAESASRGGKKIEVDDDLPGITFGDEPGDDGAVELALFGGGLAGEEVGEGGGVLLEEGGGEGNGRGGGFGVEDVVLEGGSFLFQLGEFFAEGAAAGGGDGVGGVGDFSVDGGEGF